eukprot:scaffold2363_cov159-Amphora_coffeaeformis.AAC.42
MLSHFVASRVFPRWSSLGGATLTTTGWNGPYRAITNIVKMCETPHGWIRPIPTRHMGSHGTATVMDIIQPWMRIGHHAIPRIKDGAIYRFVLADQFSRTCQVRSQDAVSIPFTLAVKLWIKNGNGEIP